MTIPGVLPVRLRVPPSRTDRFGRPWYPIEQAHGLVEHQGDELMRAASAAGYLRRIDEIIFSNVATLVRELAAGRPADIVELGGGDGHFYERVRDVARTYVNIEPGDVDLEPRAVARLAGGSFATIRCSAEDVPLEDCSADIVLAIASIDHVPDPGRALAEARRCLRPGGHLIVTLNNRRSWWKAALAGTRFLARREEQVAREHSVLWSLAQSEQAVASVMAVARSTTVVFIPFIPVVWRFALPLAERVGSRFARRWGAHSIVVGTR